MAALVLPNFVDSCHFRSRVHYRVTLAVCAGSTGCSVILFDVIACYCVDMENLDDSIYDELEVLKPLRKDKKEDRDKRDSDSGITKQLTIHIHVDVYIPGL